ncbi:MAG TPA: nitroreductase/quinone reductase family protein [Dehalococcoidia bacterium]|nr:nitroreductase/quinone reductase family protein [Dehalococcoidia bacterium]
MTAFSPFGPTPRDPPAAECGRRYRTIASLREKRKSNRYERIVNRLWYRVVAWGLVPRRWPGVPVIGSTTIEVPGRKSGVMRRIPVTWVEFEGQPYLVAMLGEESDWVHNARATGGKVVLKRGRRRKALLEELPVEQRAPILRAWYKRTGRSTPKNYIGLPPGAPLEAFEKIAPRWPVFRITPASAVGYRSS